MNKEFPSPNASFIGKVKIVQWSPPPPAGPLKGSAAPAALVSRCAADIEPEAIEWLWRGRLARGKHTCIAGEPGTGKSQLSVAIIATITTGGEWPCDEGPAQLGSAIILSAEDGAADTIIPRLLAAGADLRRIHVVSAVRDTNGVRTLNLQHDIGHLEEKIREIGDVALVVVDPVSSYLGKTDSHKNSEVRGVLEPLSEMAERTRVAVLTITHFSKAGANGNSKALHRFIGSIAFTGAPRAAFAVIADAEQEGRLLLLHVKNNIYAPPQGLAFHLEQVRLDDPHDGILASFVAWENGPVSMSANEAMAADVGASESRTAKAEAAEFLQEALAGGPVAVKEINRMAHDHGITTKVLRSARIPPGEDRTRWVRAGVKVTLVAAEGSIDAQSVIDAHRLMWASMEPQGIYGASSQGWRNPVIDSENWNASPEVVTCPMA